jgi:hypothetical protein
MWRQNWSFKNIFRFYRQKEQKIEISVEVIKLSAFKKQNIIVINSNHSRVFVTQARYELLH